MTAQESMDCSILDKLSSMEDASALALNAYEKSLRSYETKLHPLLKERLVMLGSMRDDISAITETTSYSYSRTNEGFNGQNLSNYVFQPFFDVEEPDYNKIIYLRCSKKTTGGGANGRLTMDEIIARRLSLNSQSHDRPVALRDLCQSILGSDVTNDLLQDDYRESSLSRSINRFLEENNYSFPATSFLQVPGRDLPLELEMASKYYPTRNDDRAFCKDRSILRHLTGCCLHQLFHPRGIEARRNLHRDAVLPADGKDKLNLFIPRLPGKSHRIVLNDISNFTGSNGNSWALLHVMNHQLSVGGAWDKMPNVYCVKGSFLSATWKEIIAIYLYHTVGVPCLVPDQIGLGYLPGGFLGVAANITIGLVMLAVILENLKRILRRKLDFVIAQAGGDDNCVGLVGDYDKVEEAVTYIYDHLTMYVGYVKEFGVIDLDRTAEGIIPNVKFCKKTIRLQKNADGYRITTLPSIPIPVSLSSGGYLKNIDDQQRGWRSLHLDLQRFESEHPFNVHRYADTIRQRYLDIYPSCQPARVATTVKFVAPHARWVVAHGLCITTGALNKMMELSDVQLNERKYLDSLQDRIRHVLTLGECLIMNALHNGKEVKLMIVRRSKKLVTQRTTYTHVGVVPDTELLNRIELIYL